MRTAFLLILLLGVTGCGKTVREAGLQPTPAQVNLPTTAAPHI
jgi:hypothetical protein